MKNTTGQSGSLWTMLVAAWLMMMILLGGTSLPSPLLLSIQTISAFLLAAASLWRLRHGVPGRLALAGLLLAALTIGMVAVQLIPLPPAVWQALPGRAIVAETMRLSDSQESHWMPLSLAPQMTQLVLLALLPALASFLAFLTLDRNDLPAIGFVVIFCAVVCVFIGLMQRNAPAESFLHFYGHRGEGKVTGTFGNPNFFATQLFCSIPFLAALAMTLQERFAMRGWLVFLFACAYAAVILAGLAVIGSRAGIVFAMASVLATVLIVYRSRGNRGAQRFGLLPLVGIGSLLIFGQVGMVGLLQLAGSDPLADYRSVMLGVSMETTRAFFPAGSGFGSFVPVYQMHETPATMLSSYVNHVHNDWLEVVLEGGVVAMALLAAFVMLFIAAVVTVFQLAADVSANSYFRAATVALSLMLLHSLIDYPLRTPAMAVLAAACFAIMLTSREQMPFFVANRKSSGTRHPPSTGPVRPFSRPDRGFQRPVKPGTQPPPATGA